MIPCKIINHAIKKKKCCQFSSILQLIFKNWTNTSKNDFSKNWLELNIVGKVGVLCGGLVNSDQFRAIKFLNA